MVKNSLSLSSIGFLKGFNSVFGISAIKNYYRGTVINPSQQKVFSVLVEMTLWLATAYIFLFTLNKAYTYGLALFLFCR